MRGNTTNLTSEQIQAMENPTILYARHVHDGNRYRVRGVFARSDEAKMRIGNLGVEIHHPEWGEVKDVKMVKMPIDQVQPIVSLRDLKKLIGEGIRPNTTENSPWRGYKRKTNNK